MKLAYVDTSCLVAIAFDETGASALAGRLQFDRLFSSNLLEAELHSSLARERVSHTVEDLLSWITWVHPNRLLTREFRQILSAACLKGADLWHLACALFLAPAGADLTFLTLDGRQKEAAWRLHFPA